MQTLEWMTQALVLAQASDASNWVAPVIMAIVVLLVVALAVASRRNVEDGPEPPRVTEPDKPADPTIKQVNTNLSDRKKEGFDQAEIDRILAKPAEQRTMGEVKFIKIAGVNEGPRNTADKDTELAAAEHTNLVDVSTQEDVPKASEPVVSEPEEDVVEESEQSEGVDDGAKSFEEGLGKTRDGFTKEFFGLFKGKEELNEDLRDAIEEFLYTSDIGAKAATKIMAQIDRTKDEVKRDPGKVWEFVRRYITEEMLAARENKVDISAHKPYVMLIVGVNGAGKTTTIGKLASRFKRQGKKVLVVAGDTFRAAAVEQLEVWTERVDVPIHKGKTEADPASVVFDGIERGVKEDFDVILCDTSGRLHTDIKLMDELKKIERVSGKASEGAPHETILVLDANSGQNAVAQARAFGGALGVTGLILTKLDGTARGGVIMGIGEELDVPVRFVGIGEGIKDLREFDAQEFAEALFL